MNHLLWVPNQYDIDVLRLKANTDDRLRIISTIMIRVSLNENDSGKIPQRAELSGTPYIPTSRVSTVDDLADSRMKRGTRNPSI